MLMRTGPGESNRPSRSPLWGLIKRKRYTIIFLARVDVLFRGLLKIPVGHKSYSDVVVNETRKRSAYFFREIFDNEAIK